MIWLGNIALWNQYSNFTWGGNLYMKQKHNMTWTKYQLKTLQNAIIPHFCMYKRPI